MQVSRRNNLKSFNSILFCMKGIFSVDYYIFQIFKHHLESKKIDR